MRFAYVLHRREVVLQISMDSYLVRLELKWCHISVYLHPFLVYMLKRSHGPSLVETAININV